MCEVGISKLQAWASRIHQNLWFSIPKRETIQWKVGTLHFWGTFLFVETHVCYTSSWNLNAQWFTVKSPMDIAGRHDFRSSCLHRCCGGLFGAWLWRTSQSRAEKGTMLNESSVCRGAQGIRKHWQHIEEEIANLWVYPTVHEFLWISGMFTILWGASREWW